jgi:hypothetical protein
LTLSWGEEGGWGGGQGGAVPRCALHRRARRAPPASRPARANAVGSTAACPHADAFARPPTLTRTTLPRAALRGDGDYASACCGVRAEVAKAGARWFSAVYSLHEIGAGTCFATGCNNKTINLPLAGEWAGTAG